MLAVGCLVECASLRSLALSVFAFGYAVTRSERSRYHLRGGAVFWWDEISERVRLGSIGASLGSLGMSAVAGEVGEIALPFALLCSLKRGLSNR